jgi:hypothetical protein
VTAERTATTGRRAKRRSSESSAVSVPPQRLQSTPVETAGSRAIAALE